VYSAISQTRYRGFEQESSLSGGHEFVPILAYSDPEADYTTKSVSVSPPLKKSLIFPQIGAGIVIAFPSPLIRRFSAKGSATATQERASLTAVARRHQVQRGEDPMLNDHEVKRIVEAITDYRELIHQSSNVRDQLDTLQQRWNALKQERDKLRTGLDSIHGALSQMRADYQGMIKSMTDLSATEDTVLDNVKFLVDELTSLLKKHEVSPNGVK
jgi:hypothetical protein